MESETVTDITPKAHNPPNKVCERDGYTNIPVSTEYSMHMENHKKRLILFLIGRSLFIVAMSLFHNYGILRSFNPWKSE
jgi:hypothetical protein